MALLEFHPEIDFRWLLAVPAIPLAGYVIQLFLGRHLPRKGDWLLTGGMGVVAAITVWMAAKAIAAVHHGESFLHESVEHGFGFGWFYSDSAAAATSQNVVAGILFDPLGAAMLAVVGIVSFCVHLFSIGYMHGDKRYHLFFANISLFTFAMLGLVLADNVLFLFIFWEIMGLMSYLLIGHFAHDSSRPFFHRWATWASKKAFLTTRVGDVCLFVGILMFHHHFETFRFTELWERARLAVEANGGEFPAWMTVAGLFTFGGTIGKSAQFPLHVWLPDAMAGPTPVSAMIHAATMVAAGVFLLGRMYPMMSPEALTIVTIVGGTTALFAATIGCTAFDLKAVLAWSTISQLGFMVTAVGLGALGAGMFHMVTHAFFKACLFLSAGSVIHGCHHVQDMRLMGGLWRRMPITFACMLVCTCAIAGVPFFAGFYSKDAILLGAWANLVQPRFFDGWALFALLALAIGAAFTAFYMFRLIFMTFFGEYRGALETHRYSAMIAAEGVEGADPREHAHDGGHAHGEHGEAAERAHDDHGRAHAHVPHESPPVMTIALVILAAFAAVGLAQAVNGWLADPHAPMLSPSAMYGPAVGGWVLGTMPEAIADHASHLGHRAHVLALTVSLVVASFGILGAVVLYLLRRDLPAAITRRLGLVYVTVRHRYFVDEAIEAAVLRPCSRLATGLKWIDERIVDGLVLLVGRVNRSGGFLSAWFDRVFVDGIVNWVGTASQAFGSIVRLFQTGRVQQYAAFAIAGGLLAAAWMILN